MKRIKITIGLALLSLVISGCKKETDKVSAQPETLPANVITVVSKAQVLMRGTERMNSEFFDFNSDSKLDLFIGTIGHEHFPDDPMPIRQVGESSRRHLAQKKQSQQLSIHPNQTKSKDASIQFGASIGRDWVNRNGWKDYEKTIPYG